MFQDWGMLLEIILPSQLTAMKPQRYREFFCRNHKNFNKYTYEAIENQKKQVKFSTAIYMGILHCISIYEHIYNIQYIRKNNINSTYK